MNDIRVWFGGLIAAIIGGMSNAVLLLNIAPMEFNFNAGLGKLGAAVTWSAILAAAMYLQRSPLPASLLSTTVTQTDSVTKSPGVTTTKQTTKTETTETPKEI
jgi:hypothetical protein